MKKAVHYTAHYILNPVHPIQIALIGAGGTGSFILTNLARLHMALTALGHPGFHIVCFDGDKVSESNIGRQLFSPSDVGAYKSDILITRINRFFGLAWESAPVMFNAEYEDNVQHPLANIYITAVDTARARITIMQTLSSLYMSNPSPNAEDQIYYWLDIGNTRNSGQIILGTPFSGHNQPESSQFDTVPDLPHLLDLYPNLEEMDSEEEQGPSCSFAEAISKQDLYINSTLAQFATHLLWKMIKDMRIESHGVFLNLDTMKTNPLPIKREEN
jgi:PRTRC genetic system ThiF family protein